MQQRRAGRTGLLLPALGLGTMTWGRDTDVHEATSMLETYLESGGTLLDTAPSYGPSEETIGTILRDVGRSEVLLCSKAGVRVDGTSRIDGGRGGLIAQLEASLRSLGTDHLDLWLLQVPDPNVEAEETASALVHAVTSGKVRYIGLSNHPGWATAQLATMTRASGVPMAVAQVEHSLLQRGAEREVLPACAALGLGVMAWSPLGRGVLTGKYRRVRPADSRAAHPHLRSFVEPYLTEAAAGVVEAVATAANGLGRSPAEVALAWSRDRVTTAVVGPRTTAQLTELLEAGDLVLPEPLREVLDEVTAPEVGYPERR